MTNFGVTKAVSGALIKLRSREPLLHGQAEADRAGRIVPHDSTSRPRPAPARGHSQHRRKKLTVARVMAMIFVFLPTLAGVLYYGFIASDQYAASFQLAVRNSNQQTNEASGLLSSLGGSSLATESYIVVEYLRSRQFIEDIAKDIDLRKAYGLNSADYFSRLPAEATAEDLAEYWRSRIDARYDLMTGIVTANVRAFRATDAFAISTAALKAAGVLVNNLSQQARRETVGSAEEDVKRIEIRLALAIATMKKFRDRTGILDPQKGAGASIDTLSKLQDDIVRLQTQLSIYTKSMNENAPPIINLRQRIAATNEQIDKARREVGRSGSDIATPERSSQLLGEYEGLELERQFAEKALTTALASLEEARSNAQRAQRYLAVFVAPQMPQVPAYPRRLLGMLTVFAFAFAGWAVLLLFYFAAVEHTS